MRSILMSMEETEVPADLRDGEVIEAVRLGGPRDGDTIGYFMVKRYPDGVDLEPLDSVRGLSGD